MERNERTTDRHGGAKRPSAGRSAYVVHPRRRFALRYCRNAADGAIDLEELAGAIRTAEADTERDDGTSDHRRLIAIDLHHVHLPKLSAADLLEYDPAERLVRCDGTGGTQPSRG